MARCAINPETMQSKKYNIVKAKKKKNIAVVGGVGNLRTVIWCAWDVAMKL